MDCPLQLCQDSHGTSDRVLPLPTFVATLDYGNSGAQGELSLRESAECWMVVSTILKL